MNKKNLVYLSVILVSALIISCGKDNGDPTIKFVPTTGFTGKDTLIKVNASLTVTLQLDWNGVDTLFQMDVKENDQLMQSFPIMGHSYKIGIGLKKGPDPTEKWTFEVVDQKGTRSGVSLTLTKDPTSEYGSIMYFSPVVLGAQNNTATGGFIGFLNQQATIYTLETAFANQAKVDLLYYSEPTTHATLASPGSDIPTDLYPGSRNISLWSVKNATRFLKSTMTVGDFSTLTTDAEIVDGWSDSQSVTKAVELKADEIWLMKLASGKKAAIWVKKINAADAGSIELAIKIQQ